MTEEQSLRHQSKVARISRQMRDLTAAGEAVHIHKGGVKHVVPLPGDKRYDTKAVDVSDLSEILEIDPVRKLCVLEPAVSFARLVKATLEHGLLPLVVPELEGITVGGAVAGCSIEAMSYKVGGFHDTCTEYELVDGTGEIIHCSPESNPRDFHMIHGSYGTLCILTKLVCRLVSAKAFVKMEYRSLPDRVSFYREMKSLCQSGEFDFVDGIVHSPTEYVLCLGNFVDHAPYVSSYNWLNIFYKSTRERREDYLSTYDYCFRYDTECHWMTATIPPLEWKPLRFVVGKIFLGSTRMIRWSKRLDKIMGLKKRPDVVVDVFIPEKRFVDFCSWYETDFCFYPLWIVPYQMPEPYPWVESSRRKTMGTDMIIDCAVYGKPNNHPEVDYSRLLEDKTFELGGIKTLISRNHYSREKFWQTYDKPNYEAAKARLDPQGTFPGLYEKFVREEAST